MAKKMSRNEFRELILKIVSDQPVYVYGTDIRVTVIAYSKDKRYRIKNKREYASIKFIDVPDKKAIDKCVYYEIRVDDGNNPFGNNTTSNNSIRVRAEINIEDLRAVPFKTAAAKLLFGSNKEDLNGKI